MVFICIWCYNTHVVGVTNTHIYSVLQIHIYLVLNTNVVGIKLYLVLQYICIWHIYLGHTYTYFSRLILYIVKWVMFKIGWISRQGSCWDSYYDIMYLLSSSLQHHAGSKLRDILLNSNTRDLSFFGMEGRCMVVVLIILHYVRLW